MGRFGESKYLHSYLKEANKNDEVVILQEPEALVSQFLHSCPNIYQYLHGLVMISQYLNSVSWCNIMGT